MIQRHNALDGSDSTIDIMRLRPLDGWFSAQPQRFESIRLNYIDW